MKLGAAYNIFDGEELLEGSIKSIRSCVDVVIVVYQTLSNWGNTNEKLQDTLITLQNKKLIDELILYNPQLNGTHPHFNETNKRRKGYMACLKHSCTHFLLMDCDEYYFKKDFNNVKEIIKNENYSGSACQIATYYHKPEYLIQPHYTYFVPFIHECQEAMKIGIAQDRYPVPADPTRKCSSINKFWIIGREKLEMQHYSYVRNNIAKKLYNSSAKFNFNDIRTHIDKFNSFKIGDELIYFSKYHTIKEVENYFKIKINSNGSSNNG